MCILYIFFYKEKMLCSFQNNLVGAYQVPCKHMTGKLKTGELIRQAHHCYPKINFAIIHIVKLMTSVLLFFTDI